MTAPAYVNINPSTRKFQETTAPTTGPTSGSQLVATNATSGMIDPSLIPSLPELVYTASEAIAAGGLVNLWYNAGVVQMRNADNSTGKPAHGWVNSAVASSASGTFNYGQGVNSGVTGLTPGTDYFVGTTGGAVVAASAPAQGSGYILQYAGFATSATSLVMDLNYDFVQR